MSDHAVLSPSSASRWMKCTPSARLEQEFPNKSGTAAAEGTLAHSLGEWIMRIKLKQVTKQKYMSELNKIIKDPLYATEMKEYMDDYSCYVLERFSEAQSRTKDAAIFLEHKLDMTDYVQEGFGTGDVIIVADGIMDFIDLKYGKGVLVEATDNTQMKMYAIGSLKAFDFLYDIHTVRMTIYQPRIDNISTFELSVADLLVWAVNELRPKAILAFAGKGEFLAGSHCKFCRAAPMCKANAAANLELAKYDFQIPALLDDEEVADILRKIDLLTSWAKTVKDYAQDMALTQNKKWPGFKLVAGKSNRVYGDPVLVAEKLLAEGFTEEKIYTPKELLGITAMEKSIGKADFNTHLTPLIIKPSGKPTLVEVSDKRVELSSAESAKQDFAEEFSD